MTRSVFRDSNRFGARCLRALLSLSLVAAGLATSGAASAQTSCVPVAGGVPGIPGPPDWTVALPPPLTNPSIDDPRWRGAARETFPDALAGTTPDVAVRLIHGGGSVYLQVQAIGDTTAGTVSNPGSGNVYWDTVYVAFADAAFTNVHVTKIGIDSAGATSLYRWQKAAGVWSGAPGAQPWLTNNVGFATTPVSGMSITWTINLQIATATLPGTKFWYGVGTALLPSATVETYAWPGLGGFAQPNPPDTAVSAATWGAEFDRITDPNNDGMTADSVWGDLATYSGAVPAACSGLRLEDNAIGTTNTPNYKINDNASNTFRAQLSAVGVALPAAGAVKARFRIADWGMTIGVDGSWNDIPGGAYSDNRTNDAAGLIQFTCPFPPACPTLQPGANADQCMLVEVQSASGPISFLKDSAWRNMIVGNASRFEHEAVISLIGLPADPTPRDVYLAVKTHNMPAKVDPKAPPPGGGDNQEPGTPNGQNPNDPYLRYKLQDLSPTERLIVQGQPIYEVRGYRDTGRGTPATQVLRPMVPYGYIINHVGALVGWQHELTGVGTTVTTLIPNVLYKVSVLPGGKVKIKDSIEALEKVPGPGQHPPCHKCCCDFRRTHHDAFYVTLGALALLALAKRRASRGRRSRRSA